jgi:hypothetical protein
MNLRLTMARRAMVAVLCALLLSAGASAAAHAETSPPTVSGPVTGGGGVPIVFSDSRQTGWWVARPSISRRSVTRSLSSS